MLWRNFCQKSVRKNLREQSACYKFRYGIFLSPFLKKIQWNQQFRMRVSYPHCNVENEKFTVTKKHFVNQLFIIFFSKNVTFTKFLSKKCDITANFRNLQTVLSHSLKFFLKSIESVNWFDGKKVNWFRLQATKYRNRQYDGNCVIIWRKKYCFT